MASVRSATEEIMAELSNLAKTELAASAIELDEARSIIAEFASQQLTEEMDRRNAPYADYQGAYNHMVRRARSALDTPLKAMEAPRHD